FATLVACQPTATVHAIVKRQALAADHKRVYRVMKVRELLLDRHAGGLEAIRPEPSLARKSGERRGRGGGGVHPLGTPASSLHPPCRLRRCRTSRGNPRR